MDQNQKELPDFALLGGPLHRLGRRLGLVRGATDTVALGLALGVFLWTVLVVLTLAEGLGQRVFSLPTIGGHVRLLLAIPLFFICEAAVAPRMARFVREIVNAQVVPPVALPSLRALLTRTNRWGQAWLPEVVCLLGAVLLTLAGPALNLPGVTSTYDAGRSAGAATLTGIWFWAVCMTLFRFLMLRWLWRLVLWCHFLWRLSRLPLNLIPTHPDGAAGLGYLEVVHNEFVILALAFSVVAAASFAEQMAVGSMVFAAIYPGLVLMLAIDALLFLGPLAIFSPKLWTCRVEGLSDYMAFASRYVNDFHGKWLGPQTAAGEPVLGTADLQSLADLNNSVSVVRNMRLIPLSSRLLLLLVAAVLSPMLPLLLFTAPIDELAEKLLRMLLGL